MWLMLLACTQADPSKDAVQDSPTTETQAPEDSPPADDSQPTDDSQASDDSQPASVDRLRQHI